MKNVMLIVMAALCFGLGQLSAQNYKMAAGLRLGYPVGLNGKLFISETNAIDLTLAFRNSSYWNFTTIMGGYQFQNPIEIEGFEDFDWYWGVGAAVQFWNYDYDNGVFSRNRYSGVSFGVQGHFGLEYNFEDIPLNIALGWTPTIFLNRGGYYSNYYGYGYGFRYGAFTVRYIIKR